MWTVAPYALFAATGACALAYEVIWLRLLSLVLGGGPLSMVALLSAFMGGLALGGAVGGRVATRASRPLAWYAACELAIAAYALALPSLIEGLAPAFREVYAHTLAHPAWSGPALFALAVALLLPPTALMGATYPLLVRELERRRARLAYAGGLLYAANAAGAVVGVAATGLVVLPALGTSVTTWACCGTNALVAFAAWWIARRGASDEHAPTGTPVAPAALASPSTASSTGAFAIGLALFVAGAASMLFQVAWTRVIAMAIGSTSYAFSLIVAVWIAGIAVGAFVGGLVADRAERAGRAGRALGAALAIMAVCALVATSALGRYGLVVAEGVPREGDHLAVLALQAWLLVLIIVPVTGASGALVPLALAALGAHASGARRAGRVYAANTAGAIAGTVLAAFLLLPLLGLERACRFGSVAVGALALSVLATAAGGSVRRRVGTVFAAVVSVALAFGVAPRWNPVVVAHAVYLYGPQLREAARARGLPLADLIEGRGATLYYRDGAAATVLVRQAETGELALLINGKTDASTKGDLRTQQLLAHLPIAFAPSRTSALVIGLGSGITLASARAHVGLTDMDAVEISREVIEAARGPFAHHNRDALRPGAGFSMIEGDGRAHLGLTRKTYDVISSEPSNPWIAGIANLYTRECFELARARLGPGGVIGQWMQTYRLAPDDVRMILRTFLAVFPHALLFKTQLADSPRSGDFLLVGSTLPLRADARVLAGMFAGGTATAIDLARCGIHGPEALLVGLLADEHGLARYAGVGELNTDDNAALELSAPRSLYREGATAELIEALLPGRPALADVVDGELDAAALDAHDRARAELFGLVLAVRAGRADAALRAHASAASSHYPGVDELRAFAFDLERRAGEDALRSGQGAVALGHFRVAGELIAPRAVLRRTEQGWNAVHMGRLQLELRRREEAATALAASEVLDPVDAALALARARLAIALGDVEHARRAAAAVVAVGLSVPEDVARGIPAR